LFRTIFKLCVELLQEFLEEYLLAAYGVFGGKSFALDYEIKRAGWRALSLSSRHPAVEHPGFPFSLSTREISGENPDLI
jgi:hypothetical protein